MLWWDRVGSKYSAGAKTLRITALQASCTTEIWAEPNQATTPNIQFKTHNLHADHELPALRYAQPVAPSE